MKLLYIFGNFFTIGLFSMGGGYATLPFLLDMADRSDGWLTREWIGNMLAVAQSLPGPVGANLAAYTGFTYTGIGGAFMAALGLAAPSIIIIMIVAKTLAVFKTNKIVKTVLKGLKPAATGLLLAAALGAIEMAVWNSGAEIWYNLIKWKEALIFIAVFFLLYKFKKHPIVYIAGAGILGVILKL